MRTVIWVSLGCVAFAVLTMAAAANRDWDEACAKAANHRLSGEKAAVAFDKLDPANIPSCRKAVASNPSPKNKTRLARLLVAKASQTKTAPAPEINALLKAGMDAGYLPAFGIAGHLYEMLQASQCSGLFHPIAFPQQIYQLKQCANF